MKTAREIARIRSLTLALGAGAMLTALLLQGVAGADHHEDVAQKTSQPIVAEISADWCGTCTKLKPTIEALRAKYGDRILVVVLDVSDKEALSKSVVEAQRLGISEFFERNKSRTGTVGILARGETLRVLSGETDVARYDDIIELAIAKSAS